MTARLRQILGQVRFGGQAGYGEPRVDAGATVFSPRPGAADFMQTSGEESSSPLWDRQWMNGFHDGQDPGVLVLAGPGVRCGVLLHKAHILDVAPTLLALADLPVARDFEGIVLTEAIDDAFLKRHPIHHVKRYPPRHPILWEPKTIDPEMERRLRSLGYLQ
ncbi:MAG: hypothetical protein M5R36_18425 [Deltaproteobacteria bacterium]|nr:hypothetical protein [Deltaproteobacteria bacterium]